MILFQESSSGTSIFLVIQNQKSSSTIALTRNCNVVAVALLPPKLSSAFKIEMNVRLLAAEKLSMSRSLTPTSSPPTTPGKQSYNPLFLKAKVLIEASKKGDLHTIEELCRVEVRAAAAADRMRSFRLQGEDVNTRTVWKQESPLHKVSSQLRVHPHHLQ
jgi:hypothetical protein